jgi:ribosomal protein L35
MHKMSNYWHKSTKKRPKAKRQARQLKEVTGGQAKTLTRMLDK